MKAGRELDALIAEKVRGWIVFNKGTFLEYHRNLPPFSTDIAAAWEVVSLFVAKQVTVVIRQSEDDGFWVVGFDEHWAHSPSISEAVCLAALKAAGYKEELECQK